MTEKWYEAQPNADVVLASEFQALRVAYAEAIQDIADWAGYASEYFKDKHDLAGTLKQHADRLADFAFDAAGN
jgi:hypothetical protein